MDKSMLIALAIAVAEKQHRVVSIAPKEGGISYVTEKGQEVFVPIEVTREVTQIVEYDDSELVKYIDSQLVEAVTELVNQIKIRDVSIQALENALKDVSSEAMAEVGSIELSVLEALTELSKTVAGKAEQEHSHEQYATKEDLA